MILGIDPKVDYAFKRFLGLERTRHILIDVLDRVLNPPPGKRIEDIELLDPFNPKETPDDKLSIVDIKARDKSGRQFNVEMQMFAPGTYSERVVYYAARMHQQQLREGEDYATLRSTISISFLNNERFSEVDDYHLEFGIFEKKHHFRLTEAIQFHVVELPKFTKTLEELDPDSLDIWLYFLRHGEKIDTEAVPEVLRQPMLLQALEELKMMAQSELERERYEARKKAQLDYDWILKETKAEALAQGRAEGAMIEAASAVQRLERLLKHPQTPTEQLMALSLADLRRRADELEKRLENQQ